MASASNGGKMVKWLVGLLWPVVVLIATAVIVMYGDIRVAKSDVGDIKDNDVAQDEILDELPAMGKHLESIDGTLGRLEAVLIRIDEAFQENAIGDARSHHKHTPGG